MFLDDLINELSNGEKVRNSNWEATDWIMLDDDCFIDSHGDKWGLEILLEDGEWEVYDEETERRIQNILEEIKMHKDDIEWLELELAELGY